MAKIKFINHAGILISSKTINLLVDPWTRGGAFNDSWSLVSKSGNINYKKLTHVWISHEHPDHFSVYDVKKIIKLNSKVIFIFQYTKDKRLISFIEKLGGITVERKNNELYFFNDHDYIRIINCGSIDSLSIIKIDNKVIVNMNDCIVGNEIRKLTNAISSLKVNCLLTQFGYASFISNKDKKIERRKAAEIKLSQIEEQINFFQPEYVIPFASFIYFSHKENFYMNKQQNTLEKVRDTIVKKGAIPIILYPNDIFSFTKKDISKAIKSYKYDFKNIKPKNYNKKVAINILIHKANLYLDRMKKFHGYYVYTYLNLISNLYIFLGRNKFNKIILFISDLSIKVEFSYLHGLNIISSHTKPDISLSSQSLEYIFDFDWGMDSLIVNARFEISNNMSKTLLQRIFLLGNLKSRGISLKRNPLALFNKYSRIENLEPINCYLQS